MKIIITSTLIIFLSFPALAKMTISNGNIGIKGNPCSTKNIGYLPNNSDIAISATKAVWSGALGVDWYKVKHNGIEGWSSSQNFKNAPRPKFDRSRFGRGCSY